MPDEALKEKEEELIAGRERPRGTSPENQLHPASHRREEKIQVTRADLDERIRHQAMHHNVTPEKMRQEIDKKEGMSGLMEQILLGQDD